MAARSPSSGLLWSSRTVAVPGLAAQDAADAALHPEAAPDLAHHPFPGALQTAFAQIPGALPFPVAVPVLPDHPVRCALGASDVERLPALLVHPFLAADHHPVLPDHSVLRSVSDRKSAVPAEELRHLHSALPSSPLKAAVAVAHCRPAVDPSAA